MGKDIDAFDALLVAFDDSKWRNPITVGHWVRSFVGPVMWFGLTAGVLWGLGCDAVTAVRFAFVPAAVMSFMVSVAMLGASFAVAYGREAALRGLDGIRKALDARGGGE